MAEWYRRKTWTEDDEQEYFAKLAKARKHSRAQYLRVQAIELAETKQTDLMTTAEKLLNKLFDEYPESQVDMSSGYATLGNIYKERQMIDEAISYYKKAIDFEIFFPNVLTQAYLDYSELIVKFNKKSNFEFVEKIILERIGDSIFPLEKYRAYSILSIISQYKGDKPAAVQYQNIANDNADFKTSGLRYHQDLGLVKNRDN